MPVPVAAPGLDVSGPLTDTLRSIMLFLPKLAMFMGIVAVGWIAARLLRTAVARTLTRVGFDRAVQRGAISRALARSRYSASDLIARLVYYALALVTLQIAFGVFGPNPVSDLIKGVVGWLPKAAVAIVIVVVASAIASAARDIAGTALATLPYGRLLAASASWFITGIGIIAALNQIGVATTVTTPILIATLGGILVVGLGGGLIRPMQQRWEGVLNRAAEDGQSIAEHAGAYLAARMDLQRSGMAGAQATMAGMYAGAPVYTPGAAAGAPAGAPAGATQPFPPGVQYPAPGAAAGGFGPSQGSVYGPQHHAAPQSGAENQFPPDAPTGHQSTTGT